MSPWVRQILETIHITPNGFFVANGQVVWARERWGDVAVQYWMLVCRQSE